MKFAKLVISLQKLEKTASLLAMTEILANLFKAARASEVASVVYLSLGELAPLYRSVRLNIAEKMMLRILAQAYSAQPGRVEDLFKELGDLGEVAAALGKGGERRAGLEVTAVHEALLAIAADGGSGSQERKVLQFANLLCASDPDSAKFLVRMALGKLRLGFADKTVLDALSWMEAGDKSFRQPLESAYHVCPDIGLLAKVFKQQGVAGLQKIQTELGRPLLPQRCQRVKTVAEILDRMGGQTAAEPKLDGERLQVHLDRSDPGTVSDVAALPGFAAPKFMIRAFTRNLEDVSAMFPDILAAADKQIAAENVILDGEALGFNPKTGKFVPFQETSRRKRKYGIAAAAEEIPLKYFVFDILYKDGQSLLGKPFEERRELLSETIKSGSVINLTPQLILDQTKDIEQFLKKSLHDGLEGVVLKKLDSPYEAGGRGYAWIKLKGEKDTVDAVVLGYYSGEGKRAGFGIGAFLVGIYDEAHDRFLTISKVGSGLTDEQFPEMKRRCDKLKVKEAPARVDIPKALIPDVWVTPSLVVAIRSDEISKSPLHSSSYALRFPRLVAWRDDKSAEDATSLAEVKKLYQSQR